MNIKDGDWVKLNVEISGEWSGSRFVIEKGTMGRVLKEVEGECVNVSFGMAKGIQAVEKSKLLLV